MNDRADHIDKIQAIYYRHGHILMRQARHYWRWLTTRPRFYAILYLDRKIIENEKRKAR